MDRKDAVHHGDIEGLRRLLSKDPKLAVERVSWCFTNDSALGYLGVARFHVLTDHDKSGEIAEVLLIAEMARLRDELLDWGSGAETPGET